ncbi:helix-turn-helix domain-containing protein [Amycolatopsis taiwanensis]|nr:helix-turn-helix transcriptional regulator [Amycolatopsis taiwanensis]
MASIISGEPHERLEQISHLLLPPKMVPSDKTGRDVQSEHHARPSASPVGTLWHVVSDGTEHRVLPDGVMDFVWTGDRLLFAGPDTVATSVTSPPGAVTWGLRLAPGVAHALLAIPAEELVNERIDLADLVALPRSIIDSAYDNPAISLNDIARTLWQRTTIDPAELALAASLDHAARAGRSVRDIAEQHGISERSLHRLSNRLFGYGAKTLMSIRRFQRALRLARSGTPLAEAAALVGYADQPHLARETRRLAGTTLSDLLN